MDTSVASRQSSLGKRYVFAYFWMLACAAIALGGVTGSLLALSLALGSST